MALGNCNLGLFTSPEYVKLQEYAKKWLGSRFNKNTFDATIQAYYDEHKKFPATRWIQLHLSKFKSEALVQQEEGEKNLSSATPVVEKPKVRSFWARAVDKGQGFEISEQGNDLGKKFSPLRAILPEGTIYKYGNRNHQKVLDLSGYSIEAAFALMKGYDQKGNKTPKKTTDIQGYGKEPLRGSALYFLSNKENQIYDKYRWLWQQWGQANPELMEQLREATKNGDLVLTDAYAGRKNGRSRINQAHALADIMFGEPEIEVNANKKARYEREYQNAQKAAEEVLQTVQRDDTKVKAISVDVTDKQQAQAAVRTIKNRDERDQPMRSKDGDYLPEGIIVFDMPTLPIGYSPTDKNFINPFKGKDAVKKFIEWLMPNDFESLPKELQVNRTQRNFLRTQLNKGNFQNRVLFTNEAASEGIRYADVLRYLIDNFRELRQRYNPVSEDKQNVAMARHGVIITDTYDKLWRDGSHTNKAFKLYLKEDVNNPDMLDDNGEPIRYFEVVQDIDPETGEPNGEYSVHFKVGNADAYQKNAPILFNKSQKDRLFKSVAISIPIGAKLSTWGEVSKGGVSGLDNVGKFGFKKTDETRVVTNRETGNPMEIPVYERVANQKQMVYRQKKFYNRQEVAENTDKVYLFGDNIKDAVDAANGNPHIPIKTQAVIRGLDNAIGIPTKRNREHYADSYFGNTDDDFNLFKKGVDEAIAKARQAIAEGKQVIIPAEGIGTGAAQLQTKAPRLFEYLQTELNKLEQEANAGYEAERSLSQSAATIEQLDEAPIQAERAMDRSVAENPYIRVHQTFGTRGVLNDAIETVADEFIMLIDRVRNQMIQDTEEQLAQVDRTNPDNERLVTNIETLIHDLRDDLKGMQIALKHSDATHSSVIESLQDWFLFYATDENIPSEQKELYRKLADKDTLNVLLQYATSTIENKTGVRVLVAHGQFTAKRATNAQEDADNDDDPEGKKTTGNDGWSFNVRLNDPYRSLSRAVRRIINNLEMRDPNHPDQVLTNAFGRSRTWDAGYVYTSIMSWMAKNLRNNADNFVQVITDYDALPERAKSNMSQADFEMYFPIGFPTFPILEQMKGKYIWAEDLITALEDDYSVPDATQMTGDQRINLGRVASQLYTNFNQQFVDYYIMRDGHLYAENHPSGSASLQEAVTNNYEGSVMLTGNDGKMLPMIYNIGQSINQENVSALLDKLASIKKGLKESGFYEDFNDLKEDIDNNGTSYVDAFISLPENIRKTFIEVSDALKCMGANISPYDVMCIALSKERNVNLSELFIRAEAVLRDIQYLGPDDHMINSGKGQNMNSDISMGVETAWKDFFNAFGEYVNEREYESSFRAKDGTTRYSYSAASFMSSMLINLNNPDIEQRRAFIDENFKPYAMFYDSKNNRWRNTMLQALYEGGTSVLSKTHDLISIFNNNNNAKYADWTPEMLEDVMFKEYATGTGRSETGLYIIPILSDKEVCKVVEGRRYAVGEEGALIDDMVEVVRQEHDRIKLVQKRQQLLALQNKAINNPSSLTAEEKKFLSEHQAIFDIAAFDKHGLEFCFIPELNGITFIQDQFRNSVRSEAATMLNQAYGNPVSTSYSLAEVLSLIEEMDDETFNQLVTQTSQGAVTKETFTRNLITRSLEKVMNDKFKAWALDYNGNVRSNIINSIAAVDGDIRDMREKLPVPNFDGSELTAAEKQKTEEFNRQVRNYAYNFYLNHTYAMSQFIQIMVTDVAFFDGSNDFSKRWYSIYGAGQKLNTNSKYGKKTEHYIILKDNKRRSKSFDVFKAALERAVKDGRITKIDKEVILNKFKKINGTDAQAYRSLTSYRTVMDMAGKWTPEMEKCYQNLKSGRWDMSDFNTIFQTLKPFTFSNESTDSGFGDLLRTPTIHKNSEAVLLSIYSTIIGGNPEDSAYSARAKGINMAMEDEDMALRDENGNIVYDIDGNPQMAIDVVQYQSSTKIGSQGVIDINYSRRQLQRAKADSKVDYGDNKAFEVFINDTYYSIVDRLDKAYDAEQLTEAEYNEILDYFEPDAQEVKQIIKNAITFDGTRFGSQPNTGFFNPQVLHQVPYSDYCWQQPTPEHLIDNDKGVFGSQIRHIIMSDIPDFGPDGKPWSITINGKKYTRDSLRRHYNALIVANLMEAFENEIQSLFNDNDKRPPIYRLRERILNIIKGNDKYGKEIEQALDIIEDPETGKPTFALPLNNINVTVKLEEILTSMFKNSITRQKIKGGNAILAADIGYADSLKIRGNRDKEGKLIPGEIEGIECLLPANARAFYEPFMVEKTDDKGQTYWILDGKKLEEAGLDKGIGYRIPTEGHYSAMPLIIKGFLPQQNGSMIVLAAEVVAISGSDNDVDKENLFLKAFDIDEETGDVSAIEYDPNKSERYQSKEARDNEIIDIMHAILTDASMSDKWMHPGNFDTIKLNGRRLRILKNKRLLNAYKQEFHLNSDEAAIEDLQGKNLSKDALLKKLMDFLDKYEQQWSPIYPDTFLHYHAQNMAGVAEKGIFANNTINQAKLQWADINLTTDHQFMIGGRRIKKMDDRYIRHMIGGKEVLERVSSNCAECSAASVDNAKDPVLADVNSNVKTASLFGYMLRAGLTIEEASLLLSQPYVDWKIRTEGNIKSDSLVGRFGIVNEIAEMLKQVNVDVATDPACDWHTHNFTVEELYDNIVFGRNLTTEKGKANRKFTQKETDILKSLYRTYSLIADIIDAKQDYANAVRPLAYDSPTHAIATSFAGAVLQTKAVEDLNNRRFQAADSKFFTGLEDLLIYQIEKEKSDNEGSIQETYSSLSDLSKITRRGNNDRLYQKIMDSKLPITQAFYTLGIEKAREVFGHDFMYGRPEVQEITDRLVELMQQRGIYKLEDQEKVLSKAYKDLIIFFLTKAPIFGSDEDGSYDEKRQYYLYRFPQEFLKIKGENPELNQLEALSRMTVRNGQIILRRQGQMTTPARDMMMDSFQALLSSDSEVAHKLATDLFMYTYYLNGFEFSYMSYGNLFGTQFLRAFPEYIQALRNMQTLPITDIDMDRFITQFTLKNNKMGLLENIPYKAGETSTKEEAAQNGYFDSGRNLDWYGENGSNVPLFVTVGDGEVYQYSHELSERNGSLIFIPLRQSTSLHYNAEQTTEQMMEVVYDEKQIRENRQIGSKKKSANATMRELVDVNNQEKATILADQNSYSIAEGHPDDAQLAEVGGVQEQKTDEELQKEAEILTENLEGKTIGTSDEAETYQKPQPKEGDDVQKKIDEAQSTGQIDNPFC